MLRGDVFESKTSRRLQARGFDAHAQGAQAPCAPVPVWKRKKPLCSGFFL
jgi:hypothetical protein